MSRVCLVGVGEPGFRSAPVHVGPGLRLGHFATALAGSGCDVLALVVHNGSSSSRAPLRPALGEAVVEGHDLRTLDASEAALASDAVLDVVRDFAPDALVGVTTLGASLACRLRLDVPLWADVFGDFMAEAQAKAVVHGHDGVLARFWTTLQPVLRQADRFSAVSRAQADALIGQLGLAGRLSAANAGAALVSVIPCAAEVTADTGDTLRGRVVDHAAFVVVWNGSFNTWCDVDTLFAGLELAMHRDPRIVFLATGGAVAGHDDATYRRFCSRVEASPLRERFKLMGWVAPDLAEACFRSADLGVVVERDLYERRLGSENRVVHWMARSIPCATTGLSELGSSLVRRGLALGFAPGDSCAFADVLVAASRDPAGLRAMGRACARVCGEELSYSKTASPLVEWCRAPAHAADHGRARALTIGALSEPTAMVELLEGYLDELRLTQVAYRSVRWLCKRVLRRTIARARSSATAESRA